MITITQSQPPAVGHRLHAVRCNHCGEAVLYRNRRYHFEQCRARQNAKKLQAINLTKKEGALYAVMCVRRRGNGWSPIETHYLHAHTPMQARRDFMSAEVKPRNVHIVEIGLAIGWWQDAQGNITG